MSARPIPRTIGAFVLVALLAVLAACGGGGGGGAPATSATSPPPSSGTGSANNNGGGATTPGANVATITVDGGTDGIAINEPFVSVTLCVPGTATCQTIDHILLDTGSSGLRVLASALQGVPLPAVASPGGAALAECAVFASGYTWGSVRRADVKIGGETASAIPVELVNDSAAPYGTVPTACRNQGTNMGAGQSANGILGIGFSVQDCGVGCTVNPSVGMYYACSGANACSGSLAPLASQVVNPVSAFPQDSNGISIALPAVPTSGVANVTGTLTFGIGTQANNGLGTATVYTPGSSGTITTTYRGTALASFLDSGSNGNFFTDPGIRVCGTGFYCPPAPLQLEAQVSGANGASTTVPFTVVSFTDLAPSAAAAPIAGTATLPRTFDWGLPFFFGRTVSVAFNGATTPQGVGPYWAF